MDTRNVIEVGEQQAPAVSRAEYADLPAGSPAPVGEANDLRLLSEVPLHVTVELGRTVMRVRDLLALREGSVIELDRAPGSVVDVVVNGRLVARGDVVVVDDEFGVRVTEIIDPSEA